MTVPRRHHGTTAPRHASPSRVGASRECTSRCRCAVPRTSRTHLSIPINGNAVSSLGCLGFGRPLRPISYNHVHYAGATFCRLQAGKARRHSNPANALHYYGRGSHRQLVPVTKPSCPQSRSAIALFRDGIESCSTSYLWRCSRSSLQ